MIPGIGSIADLIREVFNLELFINLTLKSTIILLIAILVNRCLNHASASVRHWIWSLTFCSLLFFPIISSLFPNKPVHLLPKRVTQRSMEADHTVSSIISSNSTEKEQASTKNAEDLSTYGTVTSGTPPSARIDNGYHRNPQTNLLQAKSKNMFRYFGTNLVPLAWSLGVLFLLIRTTIAISRLQWLSRKRNNFHSKKWEETLKDISNRYAFQRSVRIVVNRHIPIPATLGIFRPVLLIPEKATHWTEEKRRVVLLHELAHMKRHDYLTNLISQLACVLYWINPLIWIASRWFRIERESACDNFVLSQGIVNSDYAHHLLDIARSLSRIRRVTHYAVTMAIRSGFKARLEHILSHKIRQNRLTTSAVIISTMVFLLVILPLSIANLQERKNTSSHAKMEHLSMTDLINDLTTGHPEAQMRAAWAMGDGENPEAVPVLIETLKDDDAQVRGIVAWALGEIKDPRSMLPLIESLSDEDDYAREMIVKAVGEFENDQAVDPLTGMLEDRNPDIRYAAVWAMGEIGNSEAFELVTQLLEDRSARVREMAAIVLGKSGSPAPIHILMPLLSDKDQNVRKGVANILGKIGSSRAVDPLIEALNDRNPAVKIEAARALGRIGDSRAVDALIRVLQDSNPEVRSMAVWALDEIQVN